MTLAELEILVKTVSDKVDDVVDKFNRGVKSGAPVEMVFRCGHSGLLYPANYVKDWGKLFGIGLGPTPVSEALDSEYDIAPPAITPDTLDLKDIMHPIRHCMAQMDWDVVPVASITLEDRPILDIEDHKMRRRAPILRKFQLENPRGRLRTMAAAWAASRGVSFEEAAVIGPKGVR